MRSGVIAKKLGMTRLFLEDGRQVPVTVLQMDNVQVVAQRTAEPRRLFRRPARRGRGEGRSAPPRRCAATSPRRKVEPKRKLAEFRVSAPRT